MTAERDHSTRIVMLEGRVAEHDDRLRMLEQDAGFIRQIAETTHELARKSAKAIEDIEDIATRAVERAFSARRRERRSDWKFYGGIVIAGSAIPTAVFAVVEVVKSVTG